MYSGFDPIRLELYRNLLSSISEEMGGALCRSAFSSNIKERRDFSCAVFDSNGNMVAQAAHIPVHLGAMPLSVQSAIEHKTSKKRVGDRVRGRGQPRPPRLVVARVRAHEQTGAQQQ